MPFPSQTGYILILKYIFSTDFCLKKKCINCVIFSLDLYETKKSTHHSNNPIRFLGIVDLLTTGSSILEFKIWRKVGVYYSD